MTPNPITNARTALRWPVYPGFLCLIALLATGCTFVQTSERDTYFDAKSYGADPPQSIAIAPFENMSKTPEAGWKVRQALYQYLSTLGYSDVELSEVDEFIHGHAQDLDVKPLDVPRSKILDPDLADAVIFGKVNKTSRLFLFLYSRIKVDLEIEMVDTRTKKTFYDNRFIVRNSFMTGSYDPVGLIASFIYTLTHLRSGNVEDSFAETAKAVTSRYDNTLHEAFGVVPRAKGKMASLRVTAPDGVLITGDEIRIELQHREGQEASFSLGKVVSEVPMTEEQPGTYVGSYEIQDGDHATFVYPEVQMKAPDGKIAIVKADSRGFEIDTKAPPEYVVKSWGQREEGLVLQLGPLVKSKEVPALYHVYRSEGEGGSPKYIGSTVETSFYDPINSPGTTFQYSIVTEDEQGNQGRQGQRRTIRIPEKK